jgi:uncharacterized membrane protein (DUF441 family)
LAVLVALGAATPVGEIPYYFPVVNLFRVPSRHLVEFTFATSVLAGIGAAAYLDATSLVRTRVLAGTLLVVAVFTGVTLAAASPELVRAAAGKGTRSVRGG